MHRLSSLAKEPPTDYFDRTDWTLLRSAASERDTVAMPARDVIFRRYSPAVYAWARARGFSIEDAQDLVQSLFVHFIKTGWFKSIDQTAGRFRGYLMTCLKNHASSYVRHKTAQKRGEGITHLPIHEDSVIEQIDALVTTNLTPEAAFNRGWACALIDATMKRLQESYEQSGQQEVFETLSPWLTADYWEKSGKYAEAAAALGVKESTARVSVFRLREAYRGMLWSTAAEFLRTNDPQTIREELACLLAAC